MKEVYERYYEQLVFFCRKFVNDKHAAEDIVTDCMVKFFEHKYPYHLASAILYKCVQRSCQNYDRNNKTRNKIKERLFFDEEYIELQILESRLIKILNDCVHALPPDCRDVIIMYYLEEKTCTEIARLLNKTPATVRSLKRHGLNKLVSLKKLNR